MKTKKEKIAEAKIMLEAMGLSVKDLLEENSSQDAPQNEPKFLDIQEIDGVPCMYLRYNEDTSKHEWLCLEIPNEPEMLWKKGRNWCQSKGGNYGKIYTLQFISERRSEINQVLESKGYPLVEYGWHWSTKSSNNDSTEDYNGFSWRLFMHDGYVSISYKYNYSYVRAVVVS